MSNVAVVRNPSLVAYGALSVLLSMALFVIGTIVTNPVYEEPGYLVAEVLTFLCLLLSGVFTFLMRSERTSRSRSHAYGLALTVSILCWFVIWIQHPVSNADRVLMNLVALHGLFWASRCVVLARQSDALTAKSLLITVIGATACSTGIFLATRSGMTKLEAITAAACYMLCLGLQLFLVSLLITSPTATEVLADRRASRIRVTKSNVVPPPEQELTPSYLVRGSVENQ
jgi:hypothetical protein